MPSNPQYPGVYIQEVPSGVRSITGVPTNVTAFIGTIPAGALNQPVHLTCFAGFQKDFGAPTPGGELGYAVHQFFLNGGSEAWVVRIPDDPAEGHWVDGINALDSVDLFNLLVLPGMTSPPVLAVAMNYCEKRRAFLIVDAPGDLVTADQMRQWFQSGVVPLSRNAAVYIPWVGIADASADGNLRWCPPSGTMAGLFARTDSRRGVWKAPAGVETSLTGVRELKCQMTDVENGVLNPLGINCLRSFPVHGMVAWGSRTLAGDDRLASEWKYIPTRRLALFLEESLDRGLKWVVFEPNKEPLRAQIRLNVGTFMHNLFRQGAFQGQTPSDAYFVKCDRETTTPQDETRGIVNLVVGFAPLKPAEFVILKLQLLAGQTP